MDYKEYLIAGIFGQTVIFGATFTGAGIADDMQKGVIDRFRSLPMSRSASHGGRCATATPGTEENRLRLAAPAIHGSEVLAGRTV